MSAGPTVSGSAGSVPTISAWRSTRRRHPRIIAWISTAITSATTPAITSDATSVGVFTPGSFRRAR